MIMDLTALLIRAYTLSIETSRAVSGLRGNTGRRFLVFRANMPECSTNREAWTVLLGRDNTRVFLLPEIETSRRCLMAQTTKSDALASVKETLTSQLREVQLISRMLLLCSGYEAFELKAADVQVLVKWLLHYVGNVQTTLKEIEK
jgi:hypothetical protein